MKSFNLAVWWALRGSGAFRRRLVKEITAAHQCGEAHRAQQLEALPHLLQTQKLDDESHKLHLSLSASIPNAFRCVLPTTTTALYTKCSSSGRPYQVWMHGVGSTPKRDTLLFEEKDERCTVDVALTRDGKYVTINSNTRTSSQIHLLNAKRLADPPLLVRTREHRVEYYMDHAHEQFYVFTNLGPDKEYKILTSKGPQPDQWEDYYKPKNGFILQDMELYEKHVVLYGARDLVPVAIVIDTSNANKEPLLLYCEDACHIEKSESHDFQSESLFFWLSSPATPPKLYTFSGQEILTSQNEQRPSGHVIERVKAKSKDGCLVPMTLCYHKDLVQQNSQTPVLVHVYGSYGENQYMGFCPEKQWLLNRGWILAYCHTRSGGELGRRWYYAGQGRNKHKTFEDLHACVQYLHREGYSQPVMTTLLGKSAGAMVVGMFCNLWPQLAQAIILQAPFVNVIKTLSDPSLYLSVKDYEEFGNPNATSAGELQHVMSICPYSNLKPQEYPSMMIVASKADDIIPFAGVQSYVNRLQRCTQQAGNAHTPNDYHSIPMPRGTILFHVVNHKDHYSIGDVNEVAMETAFLHRALGLPLNT